MPTPQCTITRYSPSVFPEMRDCSGHDIGRRWKDEVVTHEIPFKAYDDDGEFYFSGAFRPKADQQWLDDRLDAWLLTYYSRFQNAHGVTSLQISEDYGLTWVKFP